MNGTPHLLAVPEPMRFDPPQRPTQASRWARLAKGVKAKPETPALTAGAVETDLATKH